MVVIFFVNEDSKLNMNQMGHLRIEGGTNWLKPKSLGWMHQVWGMGWGLVFEMVKFCKYFNR
jgi:hypothetical protein